MDKALEWIVENGIEKEDDYPYEAVDDVCRYNKTKVVVSISSFNYVKENDENELKKAVGTVGPISVAIDATGNFQFYSSGWIIFLLVEFQYFLFIYLNIF